MKTVIQGESINFRVLFYDKEPNQGGVLIDPDNSLHTWRILNERHHHVVSVALLENNVWPSALEYFFAIQDDPLTSKFQVLGYDTDAARIAAVPGTELVSTGWLAYGVYVAQALNPVASPAFSGSITMTFPDAHNFSWVVTDDIAGYCQSVNLLQAGEWPVATQFWFKLTDIGTGYVIDGYDDILLANNILTTGPLAYGPVINAPFTDVQALLYAGDITADYAFPGAHVWIKENDIDGHISDFTLLKNSVWPSQERYWLSIEDMGNGTDYHVRGYGSDADRLARVNALFESDPLLYSLQYTDALLNDLSGEFYLGTVSCLYTGLPHSWVKSGDLNSRILESDLQFWYNNSFPPVPQPVYYGRIEDDGTGFRIRYYKSDADRISGLNWIAETLMLPYGSYVGHEVLEVEAGYSGEITVDYPASGVVHAWVKTGDPNSRISDISLLYQSAFPPVPQATYYGRMYDDGLGNFIVKLYLSDADRIADMLPICETANLPYGNLVDVPLNTTGLDYNGELDINFPGLGAPGFEDFEITDSGWGVVYNEDFEITDSGWGIIYKDFEEFDPNFDPTFHFWQKQNDPLNYTSDFSLQLNLAWPLQATFWLSIEDNGVDFKIVGYGSDADRLARTNALFETAALTYGTPYDNEPFVDLQALGYSGSIDVIYTGPGGAVNVDFEETDPHFSGGVMEVFSIVQGGGIEHFEIEDIGVTQPVYEIWDENNVQVVAETIFPVRIAEGTFETDYAVALDAVTGENWRLVARGKISGADTFITIPFRVVDADEALDEAAMLVTLSETKQFLEIYQDDLDGYLTQLINAASKAVETYTGTFFHVETKMELVSGTGRDVLHIVTGPVNGIIKMERRDSGTLWSEIPVSSFIDDSFFIQRIEGGVFDEGIRNWRVTYRAGYDRANSQVRLAVKMLVKYWYHTKDRTGVTSDVVGGGLRVNYQEVTEELPPDVKQILRPYKRFV